MDMELFGKVVIWIVLACAVLGALAAIRNTESSRAQRGSNSRPSHVSRHLQDSLNSDCRRGVLIKIPQLHRVVTAAAGNPLCVRAERHALHE